MKSVCKDCGTVAAPKEKARGTMAVEVILWLCFLVPGLIYSVWRLSNKYESCPACGSEKLLPVDSPLGKQVANASGYAPEPPRRPSTTAAAGIGHALGSLVGRLKK